MGGGMYQCSLCNFTAHIKQSLTVHIQNHHLSPDKARSARRRNKVGASDQQEVSASTSSSSGITGSASATVIPGGVALFSDADEVPTYVTFQKFLESILEIQILHFEKQNKIKILSHRDSVGMSKIFQNLRIFQHLNFSHLKIIRLIQ